MFRLGEAEEKIINAEYSAGLLMKEDGTVVDAVHGSPAAVAGIGPSMKVVAVNGRAFSSEVWHDAVKAGKNSSAPLDLLVENAEYYTTFHVNYHGGEQFPHLERDNSKPDLLSDIIKVR
jgi:predicted metalloprotease with PDZ domain